ncbi:unnamed protein product, partial [marine sediment metagenome]
RKAGILVIIVGLFFGLLLSFGIGFYAVDTWNRGEALQKMLTLNNRTLIWAETLETGLEKLWIGRGYVAGNRDMLNERLVEGTGLAGATQGHNAVLAAFIDTGIIGAVLIIAFYFEMSLIVLKNVLAMRRTKENFWLRAEICSIGVAIVAQCIPSCGMAGKVSPAVIFALLTALAIALATNTFGLGIKASRRII